MTSERHPRTASGPILGARSGLGQGLGSSLLLHGALILAGVATMIWVKPPPPQVQRLALEATLIRASVPVRPSVPRPRPQPEESQVALPERPEPEPPKPDPPQAQAPRPEAPKPEAPTPKAVKPIPAVTPPKPTPPKPVAPTEEQLAEQRRQKEAELAQKAVEQARKDAAAAARAQTQREQELNAQIAAEERLAAARSSGLADQYVAEITARIERAWIRPASAQAGLSCEVHVTQVPGGAVVSARVGDCNGNEAVRQSIEAAVFRASPLPVPKDPALFERRLVVTFRPEN